MTHTGTGRAPEIAGDRRPLVTERGNQAAVLSSDLVGEREPEQDCSTNRDPARCQVAAIGGSAPNTTMNFATELIRINVLDVHDRPERNTCCGGVRLRFAPSCFNGGLSCLPAKRLLVGVVVANLKDLVSPSIHEVDQGHVHLVKVRQSNREFDPALMTEELPARPIAIPG